MFAKDLSLQKLLFHSHNFGHNGPLAFSWFRYRWKKCAVQAAMGLAMISCLIWIKYWKKKSDRLLQPTFECPNLRRSKYENTKWNYSYYPIILKIKHNFSN
jgi:hypothetical protein